MSLTPGVIIAVIAGYFAILLAVSHFTGKKSSNAAFFRNNRQSPWYLVAFGMIGASLSGVTFISIPGAVGGVGLNMAFSYMQIVFGYLLGYVFIAEVLMPLYYRLNLTTIYGYLGRRFDIYAHKTGAAYFLLSRTIGSAFRLFLVAIVLQHLIMDPYGVPFWITVAITIVLIWIYTFKGGIRTIVYTDTLQTICMLAAVILTILAIGSAMDLSITGLANTIRNSDYSQLFFFEGGWADPNNFFKQFFSGALITIVMTGLDQDMMQKNLSCRNIAEAKKNMYTFSFILVFANILFVALGALLYIYAGHVGAEIPARTDQLYPMLAMEHLPVAIGLFFVLGLVAAAYSSADSAMTALTTSFCVDFLGFERKQNDINETPDMRESNGRKTRILVHIGVSVVMLGVILLFNALNNDAVINNLFKAAGYTYGPLLGLFAFGLFTRLKAVGPWIILVCLVSPVISALLDYNSAAWFAGFEFGFLIIALNGLITFLGLWVIALLQNNHKYDESWH